MRRTPSSLRLRQSAGRPPLPNRAHTSAAQRTNLTNVFAPAGAVERHPLAASALAPFMFDLEDDPAPSPAPAIDPAVAADAARVAVLASPATPYEATLAAAAAAAAPYAPTAAALAAALAAHGHAASVCTVTGGGSGTACFNNLKHEHVVVTPPSSIAAPAAPPVIVDASFRDALAVVSPPPSLAALIAALPPVWTGSLDRLEAVVRIVANRTRAALASDGRPTPPWRTASALLSKWRVAPRQLTTASSSSSYSSSTCGDDCCFEGAASPTGPLPPPARAVAAPAAPKGGSPAVSQLSAALAAGRATVDVAMAVAWPAVRTVRWGAA